MRLIGAMLLCIALAACASKSHWKYDQINSGSSEFNSSRLSFVLPDSPSNLQLEILRTKNACRGYLYVHAFPIPAYQNDKKNAEIFIAIEDEAFSCLAQRHEGGHRLVLSESILNQILNALEHDQKVNISTSGYKTTLNPNGFSSQHKKLKNSH